MAQTIASGPRAWLLGSTALLPVAFSAGPAIAQSPTGGQVVAGQASIAQSGNTTVITQSTNRGAINWQQFNVGRDQAVQFQQPNAGSWTLNRITGADPSTIAGRVTANGGIAIVNPSGVVFAGTAQVNVANLIASTANITNENFMAGRMQFNEPGRPGARVENHGNITVADRGMAALVAPGVSNSGTIRARLGRVALQGAEAFALDLAGDGLLSIDVTQAVRTAPSGATALVTNTGTIDAAGGSVLISAHAASGLVEDLVRHTGRISAETVGDRTGQVALTATGGGVRVDGAVSATGAAGQRGGRIAVRGDTATTVTGTARIDASGAAGGGTVVVGTTGVGRNQTMSNRTTIARGATVRADATVAGQGGTIAVNATEATVVEASLSARGGPQGGDGGFIELSSQGMMQLNAGVDLAAPAGRVGTFLLDPQSIRVVEALPADPVVAGGNGSVNDPGGTTVTAISGNGVTFVAAGTLNALNANVLLEAKDNISVQGALNLGANTLRLFANGAIDQSGTGTITAGSLIIRALNGTSSAGSATLGLANAIGTLDAQVTGLLQLNNGATALTVAHALGSTVSLSTTSTLTLNGAVGLGGGAVVLSAGGAITQTAGAITAGTLTIRGGDGVADAVAAVLDKANAVGTLDARATGTLTLNNGATGLTVTNAVGSAVTLRSSEALVLNGAVGLAGGTVDLRIDKAITQTAGSITTGALNIRAADGTSAALSAVLDKTNAVGALDAMTSGAVTLANGTTALTVSNAFSSAVTLSTTSTMVLTGTVGLAGGTVALNADGAITQPSGGIVADTLTIRGSTGVGGGSWAELIQANAVGTLDAITSNGINYSQDGALTVLRATSDNVAITTGTGPLALTGDVSGSIVTLTAIGSTISQSGGTISATTRLGAFADGAITLNRDNSIAALRAQNGTGGITVRSIVAMDASARSGAGDVALTGDTLRITTVDGLAGVIGANVSLTSLGGGITQDQAIAAAGGGAAALTVASAGGVTLTDAGNLIGSLTATGVDAVDIASASNLTVVRAAGSSVALSTTGTMKLQASASGGLGVEASGNVALTTESLTIGAVTGTNGDAAIRSTGGAGTVSLRTDTLSGDGVVNATTTGTVEIGPNTAGRPIALANAIVPGTLVLTPAQATTQMVTGTLRLGETTIGTTRQGGALTVTDAVAPSALQVKTAIDLVADGTLTIGNAIGRSGLNLSLRGANAITQAAGAIITADALTIRGVAGGSTSAGGITLDLADNALGSLDAMSTAGIAVRSAAVADLTIARATSTGTGQAIAISGAGGASLTGDVGGTDALVALRFSGAIDQSGGAVTGASLSIRDFTGGTTQVGAVTLDQANAVGAIDIAAGAGLSFNNGTTALVANRATTGAGAVTTSLTTTGDLTLNGTIGGDATGIVALNSGGAIDQAGGSVTAGTLTIRGATGGASAAASINLAKTNTVAALDAFSAAGLTFRNGATSLTVLGAVGTDVSLTTGGNLVGAGAIGSLGATVALNVDGGITQSGGAITAAGLTIRDAATGTSGPAGVALGQANAVGKLDAISTKGLTFVNGATDLVATRATAAAGQAISLTSGGNLALGTIGGGSTTAVALNVAGDLSQGSGGISASSLTIRGIGGVESGPTSVVLGQSSNAVSSLDVISTGALTFVNGAGPASLSVLRATTAAGQAVAITGGAAVDLAGNVGGTATTDVSLFVAGALSQSGGAITADALAIANVDGTGSAASIALNQANAVASLDARSSGAIGFNNGITDLIVTRAATGAGAFTTSLTTKGGLQMAGAVGGNVANSVVLRVDGAITQSAPGITAGSLTITDTTGLGGATSIDLTNGNAIGTLRARASGALAVGSSTDLAIVRAEGSTVNIASAGALTVTDSAFGGLGVQGATDVALTGTALNIGVGAFSNGGAAIRATDALSGTVTLRTDALNWTGLISAPLAVNLGPLSAKPVVITTGAAVPGAMTINPGALTSARLQTGTLRIGLTTIGGSTVLGSGVSVQSALTPDAGAITTGLMLVAGGGGSIDLNAAIGRSGLAIELLTDGAVTQTASGLITAGTLFIAGDTAGITAVGAVDLDQANAVGSVRVVGSQGISFANGATDLSVAGATTAAGQTVTLTSAGQLVLAGNVGGVGASVALNASGALSQTGGAITAGSLTIRNAAGGVSGPAGVALDRTNSVASLNAVSTKGLSFVNDATDLTVAQATTSGVGQAVTISTGGKLALGSNVGGNGAAVRLNTPGEITQTGGAITAATLTIRDSASGSAGAASVALAQTNAVGSLDAFSKAGLAFTNDATALNVVAATGSSVTLRAAGDLIGKGAIGGAGASVALQVDGAISQTAGAITAAGLTIRDAAGTGAAASVALAQTNAVGSLDAFSKAGLAFTNDATALNVVAATGSSVTLRAAGDLIGKGAIGGAGASVALQVDGAISQTAGAITAAGLTIRDAAGTGAAASVALAQTNAVGSLDAFSKAGLAFTNDATALNVVAATGSSVTLRAAGDLIGKGAIGGAGASVALQVDGAISQTAGAITAAGLTIRDAAGTGAAASVALAQTNAVGSLDAFSKAGLAFTNDATALNVVAATGGSVTLRAAGDLIGKGAIGGAGASVALQVDGAISQTAGAITAAGLTIRDAAGTGAAASVALAQTNAVGSLDAFSKAGLAFTNDATALNVVAATGSSVTLRAAGDLIGKGAIGGAGASVALQVDGAISQTAGAITAAGLTIRDAAGTGAAASVALAQTNAVGSLDAFSKAGLAFTNDATALNVVAATGSSVTLRAAGDLIGKGAIGGAGASVALQVDGAISQTAGAITAAGLTIRDAAGTGAAASVALAQTNAVGSLDAFSKAGLAFTNDATALNVVAATGGSVTLRAAGDLIGKGAIGGAGASVALQVDGAISQTAGAITAAGLTIRDAAGTGAPASVALAQTNAVGSLDAFSKAGLAFTNDATALNVVAATGSSVTLRAAGDLIGKGAIGGAGASVALQVDGAISQTAGAITAAGLTIRDAAGTGAAASVALAQTNAVGSLDAFSKAGLAFTNDATALNVVAATGGSVTLRAAGDLIGKGAIGGAGASVALQVDGAISQTAGAITAAGLTIRDAAGTGAAASVALAQTNAVGSLDAFSKAGLAFTNDATALNVVAATGSSVTLRAAGDLIGKGAIGGAGASVALQVDGAISQTAGAITAAGLTIRDAAGTGAAASVALAQTNAVGSLDAFSKAGLAFTNDATALNVVAATGGSVTLRAAGDLIGKGAIGGAGASVALQVDGAISQTAGAITAAGLTIRDAAGTGAAASVALAQTNAVGSLDAFSKAGLAFTNDATALNVVAATGSSVTLRAAGDLIGKGAIGGAGASVALQVDGAISQSGGAITAAGLTIRDAAGTGAAASVALAQTNAVGSLDAFSKAGLAFTNDATALNVVAATGSSVTLRAAGDLIGKGAIGGAGASVALQVDGAISQTAGAITAAGLTIRDAAGTGAAASVALAQTNAVGSLDAFSKAGLAFTNDATALNVVAATGGSVTLRAAGDLIGKGAIGGAGASVALQVDGAISQTAGAITAAGLTIRDAAGTGAPASVALAQTNAVGSLDAFSKAGLAFTNDATALNVVAATGSSVTLRAAGDLIGKGAIGGAGASVALQVDGAISQTAGAITAAGLTIRDAAGTGAAASVALAQTNAVGSLDAFSKAGLAFTNDATALNVVAATGGSVTLRAAGDLIGKGAIGGAGASVALQVDGAISQTAGAITAAGLTIRDAAGTGAAASVALAQTNAVGSLDAFSKAGLAFTNDATALNVVAATGSSVTLRAAGDLIGKGAIGGAGASVALQVDGAISQTAGAITAAGLTIRDAAGTGAAASVALAQTNAVGSLDAFSKAGLAFTNDATALNVVAATGGSVTLRAAGDLIGKGAIGGAGASVALQVDGAISQTAGAITAAGLTIRDAAGTGAAASVALAQTNAVGSLDAFSKAGLAFTNDATALNVVAATGGSVTLRAAGDLIGKGAIGGAGASVALQVDGAISQSGGAITAAGLTIRDAAGTGAAASVALAQTNAVGSLDAFSKAGLAFTNDATALNVARAETSGIGQTVSVIADGAIDLSGAVGGNAAVVNLIGDGATGTIGQSGGIITAATLNVAGPQAITLLGDNAVTAIQATATTGDIAINTLAAATVAARTGAGGVTLLGDSLFVSTVGTTAGISADTVNLTARSGAIGQDQAIIGTGLGAALLAVAANGGAGAVTLLHPGNRISSIAGTTTGTLGVLTTTALSAGTITAGGIGLTGPSIAIAGIQTAPVIALRATAGGITQAAGAILAGAGGSATALSTVSAGATTLTEAGNRIGDASITAGTAGAVDDVALTSASALTLRTLALGGGVAAGARNVTIVAPTLTLAGVTTTGALTASTAGAIGQTAGLATGGLLTMSAGGAITLDRTDNAFASLGTVAAGGASVLRTTGSLATTAGVTVAGGLILRADGNLTIAAAGPVQVTGSGDATLTSGAAMQVLGNVTAAGGATLTSGGAMTVQAAQIVTQGGDMTLNASGALSILSGAGLDSSDRIVVAANQAMTVQNAAMRGGSVSMAVNGAWDVGTAQIQGRAGNVEARIGGASTLSGSTITAAGTAVLTGNAGVAMTRSVVQGADAAIVAAGSIALDGSALVAGPGAATLSATAGDVTLLNGSSLSATGATTIQASGALSATTADIRGGSVAMTAGGSATLASSTVQATSGNAALTATSGAITLNGGSRINAAAASSLSAGGDALLDTGSLLGGASLRVDAARSLTLRGAALTATNGDAVLRSGVGATSLTSSSLLASGRALISAGDGQATNAGGSVTLTESTLRGATADIASVADIGLVRSGVQATAGDASLASGFGNVALSDNSSLVAGGRAAIGANGGVSLLSSSVSGASAAVSGRGGTVSLNAASINATSGDATLVAGGGLSMTNAASLRAAGAASVDVGGAINVVQSSVQTGGAAALRAAGGITFDRSTGQGGAFGLNAGQGISLVDTTLRATAGDVTARAGGGMTATALTLNADAGNVALSAGGAGNFVNSRISARDIITVSAAASLAFTDVVIDPSRVVLSAGGDFFGTRLTGVSSGLFRIEAGGSVLLTASAFTADVMEVMSGQPGQGGTTITLDGVTMTIGAGAFLAAGGGVLMPGLLTVRPSNTNSLAPLVIDTRRGTGTYTSLPGTVRADVPGLDPADQPSQVGTRLNPTSTFTPIASTEPGGAVQLNLLATDLPVFLLLNGGAASGDIIAGRLSVQGAGGRVEVSGRLGPFDGSAAAARATLSTVVDGAYAPAGQQNYRFNNCVLGSVNCTVLAVLVPVPVPTREITELRTAPTPRDPDALLPNIAEEDF
ncbi:filamentous hemagglutinin N-terminal domain-containing protein [Humitalea sp. 24SJ18S-53]|uniref:filamentous hemagglutinin N-terminal domain-containing protein n=1 Tax=Humitalea sp. 24SJ18S-53 TaxID=3422307 RepID=UPI003D67FD99